MDEGNTQEMNHSLENQFEEVEEEEEHALGQEDQEDEAKSELFWKVLQDEVPCKIPLYVRNLLRLCHLDTPLTFRCIRDETIAELERFGRRTMKYQLMGAQVKAQHYYGPFHRMPGKFRLAIGDRFLIKHLVAFAKSKSDDFWRRRLGSDATHPTVGTPTTSGIRLQRCVSLCDDSLQQHRGAVSEPELSEEEEKPEVEEPLDLDRERRKLADMVRNTLMNEKWGAGVDSSRVAARVKVRVEMKPMEEADGICRDIVTGFIKCVFCPTRLMIRKQTIGNRKPRWVISNYRRHIRFHRDGKLKRPSPSEFGSERPSSRTVYKPEFLLVDPDHQVDEQSNDAYETEQAEGASA